MNCNFNIQNILEKVNIVDVISSVVSLSKCGKNYRGYCPFHNENTPSFIVNEDKQLFHCFGCEVGGNVFSFLKRYYKVGFYDALRILADEYGIDVPVNIERINRNWQFIMEKVAKHYQFELKKCEKALEYLLVNRGISLKTIDEQLIGYAYNLSSVGIDQSELLKLGILAVSKGKIYSPFNERIVFPIFDLFGRIVSFGGRIIGDNGNSNEPKYINGSDTEVYSKRNILYGLNEVKNIKGIKESGIIIVEGYMDRISLVQAGISNVVATLGTSLTKEQVRLITRYTDKVYLVYDSDIAGTKAVFRAIPLLLQAKLQVNIVILPYSYKDPDLFIRERGKTEFEELLKKSVDFIDYYLFAEKYFEISSPEQKEKIILSILENFKVMSPFIRDKYLEILSKRISVSREYLVVPKKEEKGEKQVEKEIGNFEKEKKLLGLIIRNDLVLDNIKEIIYRFSIFSSNSCKTIFDKFISWKSEGGNDIKEFINFFVDEEEIQQILAEILLDVQQDYEYDPYKAVYDYVFFILKDNIEKEMEAMIPLIEKDLSLLPQYKLKAKIRLECMEMLRM